MALRAIRYRMIEMKAIKRVPLGEIDLSDETFSVNFMPDLERLRSSIMELGLIQPVLLRENRTDTRSFAGLEGFRSFENLKILTSRQGFSVKKKGMTSVSSLSPYMRI